MCFVCGESNPAGVRVRFYEQVDGSILARFRGADEHQGYPGRMHGGVISAIMDETMARANMTAAGDTALGITVTLTLRYCKPVPLETDLTAVARVTKEWPRMFEGRAELRLPDGAVAAEASGRYVKVDLATMPEFDMQLEEWCVRPD
jgi:acyl-coenzyme A thioesterase PaaI-like protein